MAERAAARAATAKGVENIFTDIDISIIFDMLNVGSWYNIGPTFLTLSINMYCGRRLSVDADSIRKSYCTVQEFQSSKRTDVQ